MTLRIANRVARIVPLLLTAASLHAQGARVIAPATKSTPTMTEILRGVDQLIARNDSAGALAMLDSAIATDRKSGPLWHRYGQIAWGMSQFEDRRGIMRPNMIVLRMRADSAMRYATAFAPDSAQYWLDLGDYAMSTDNVFVRSAARQEFVRGAERARAQGNPVIASRSVEQLAKFDWRDYDGGNHRALRKAADVVDNQARIADAEVRRVSECKPTEHCEPTNLNTFGPEAVLLPVNSRRDRWDEVYTERLSLVTPITGEKAFQNALNGFREAAQLDPTNASVRRHLYGALADHQMWDDLKLVSDQAIARDNTDTEAWLTRGLVFSAREQYDSAAVAFDKALQLMSAAERSAFTNIKRIMPPSLWGRSGHVSDTLHWDSLPIAERQRQSARFWNLADPRSRTRVNEAMVEFFARVTYADWRFGSEEYQQRGADTDRGDTWVRYGPPDMHFSMNQGDIEIIWIYKKPRMTFVFNMKPTFGTAHVPGADRAAFDSIHSQYPIAWTNMPVTRLTWPMRTRVARFRSSADSMDAVITATVPVRSFLDGAELSGQMPITVQLDIHDPLSRIVGRELRNVSVAIDKLPVGINGTWVRRIGRGENVVRVDAEQADVNRAATGTSDAVVDTTSGFGMSDLLLGTDPAVPGPKAPARWRDVSIAPTTGVFPWAQSVGVVWEVYDLVPQDGNVRYKVNVQLSRMFTNNLSGFVARIAAYTKNVIERDGSGSGSISVGYDQTRAASAVTTDFLSINLNGSVTGTYKLVVEIEDLVSKRITRRSTQLILAKD